MSPTTDPLYGEAIRRLQRLFSRAGRLQLNEPTAATLATVGEHGGPSTRTVLLKRVDSQGLVFYTNQRSRKGRQLARNPRVAVCLFVDRLMEQALLEGVARPVSPEEADAYWATRDRVSQLGAWASDQSRPLDRRLTLIARVATYRREFAGRQIPRPPHWSGYRIVPDRIEFWKARPFRLNERVLYERRDNAWTSILLYP